MINLVSAEYIKLNTYINESVDEKLIYPAVKVAQETVLRSALNTCLYDKLITLVTANVLVDGVGYELYQTLLNDYISNYLAWQTVVELTPYLNVKIDNSTINKHSKETAQPASKGEVDNIIEKARFTAESYKARMLTWLNDSDNRIDEFFNCTECQDKSTGVPRIEF